MTPWRIHWIDRKGCYVSAESDPKVLWKGNHLAAVTRGKWEYVTRVSSRAVVAIVPVTDDGKVVLVEQFRPAVQQSLIELPAGLAGDIAGAEDELLVEAAKRELLEETGHSASRWTELGAWYPSAGLTDELITFFLAEGLTKTHAGGGDESESITVHEVPFDEALSFAQSRGAVDLKLPAGLFAALQIRKLRVN